jgi:hypothetical protein
MVCLLAPSADQLQTGDEAEIDADGYIKVGSVERLYSGMRWAANAQ